MELRKSFTQTVMEGKVKTWLKTRLDKVTESIDFLFIIKHNDVETTTNSLLGTENISRA